MKIGNYEIEHYDSDNYIVRMYYSNGKLFSERVICGGDLETVLSIVFIDAERPTEERDRELGRMK